MAMYQILEIAKDKSDTGVTILAHDSSNPSQLEVNYIPDYDTSDPSHDPTDILNRLISRYWIELWDMQISHWPF